jgi:F0F1-type ATP synthase membrane subunit c/vacuolar-type H+-ATPase subunit K
VDNKKTSYIGAGIAIGVGVGVALGNIGVGIALGLVFGTILSHQADTNSESE